MRWIKKHPVRSLFAALLAGFLIFNLMAALQARAMTHFSREAGVERTHKPERLSIWQKFKVLTCGVSIPRPENQRTPADVGLKYETKYFTGAHGLKIEAWQIQASNSKGTVILFHGYCGCKDSLLEAAEEFHSLGYDTLLVDFYGSGGSAGDDTSIGYYEAEDVVAAYRYVKQEKPDQPVILYGVSMGAAAILRAVGELGINPDALILECPFDRLFATVQNRFAAMRLPSFPAAQLLMFWGGVLQGFDGFKFNPMDYARNVKCPVLLMNGGADPRVTKNEAENIAKNLNSESEFKLFPDLSHQSYVATHKTEWRSYVSAFLDKIDGLKAK